MDKKHLTIEEIAQMADVSVSTVSRVLNANPQVAEELAERVNKVIRETGYSPSPLATSFARGRMSSIALISGMPEIGESTGSDALHSASEIPISNPAINSFVLALSVGIYDTIEPGGYHLRLVNVPRASHTLSNEEFARWFDATVDIREISGVIFINPAEREPVIDILAKRDYPCVVIGDTTGPASLPRVDVDNVEGVRSSTNHLLALGHRQIAFLCPKGDRTVIRDRAEGFTEAFEFLELPLPKAWWIETPQTEYPLFSYLNARRAIDEALKSEFPYTAVVAYNDEMAFGAIQAFAARGWKVPERVSVMGFDDLPAARMFAPPLSTVRQDIIKLGQYAARLLLRKLKGKKVPLVTVIPTELVVRESTAVPHP